MWIPKTKREMINMKDMKVCKVCGYKDRWWKPPWLHPSHKRYKVSDLPGIKAEEIGDDVFLLVSDMKTKTSRKLNIKEFIEFVRNKL
jgi:hypothetical protein